MSILEMIRKYTVPLVMGVALSSLCARFLTPASLFLSDNLFGRWYSHLVEQFPFSVIESMSAAAVDPAGMRMHLLILWLFSPLIWISIAVTVSTANPRKIFSTERGLAYAKAHRGYYSGLFGVLGVAMILASYFGPIEPSYTNGYVASNRFISGLVRIGFFFATGYSFGLARLIINLENK